VQIESLRPQDAPDRLRDLSPDVRAAVLIDAAGSLVSMSPEDGEGLAELVRELVAEADAAAGRPAAQLEAQVDGGAVFVTRDPHYVLAAVTRKAALSSLMLYDQRALLSAMES
jgi:hypothetical protein